MGLLNQFQVFYFATLAGPALRFPAESPGRDAVDRILRVAVDGDTELPGNGSPGKFKGVVQAQQLGGIVGAGGIVEAIPELCQRARAVEGDTGAGLAGIGVTGAITVDVHLGTGARSHRGSGLFCCCLARRGARRGALAVGSLGFRPGRERLVAGAGKTFDLALSFRPAGVDAGRLAGPDNVVFLLRHGCGLVLRVENLAQTSGRRKHYRARLAPG